MTITTHCLGLPRMGARRELKFALEGFWAEKLDRERLIHVADTLQEERLQLQRQAGLSLLTVGDFALYDHVLDTMQLVGAIPKRFSSDDPLLQSFRMARGRARALEAGVSALEMTKWMNTNYHYLVPEFYPDMAFRIGHEAWFQRIAKAQTNNELLKVSLLGPVSFLYLGKEKHVSAFNRLSLLPSLLETYAQILHRLESMGIAWVQLEEPVLALDLAPAWKAAFEQSYFRLRLRTLKILLGTSYGPLLDNLALACALPTAGLHLDTTAVDESTRAADLLSDYKVLSVGAICGRNVWRADLARFARNLNPLWQRLGQRLWIGSSCSLLHLPWSLTNEQQLPEALRQRLAFAAEKLHEIGDLAALLQAPECARAQQALTRNQALSASRPSAHMAECITREEPTRAPFAIRYAAQTAALKLPELPTTTIGSFPQTADIRTLRAAHKRGQIATAEYDTGIRQAIADTISTQEHIGLDVLVHGEAERNDMVEYFAEHLQGYAVTLEGWVQSYGSRCVKPPILHDDVTRPTAMTVEWTRYAQSLTNKPVKGMLTGPVTLLQWSFVRNDLPRFWVARQVADAIAEEVRDLERSGIRIIQIDEPAYREGLPLRRTDHAHYWNWASHAFRSSYAGVADSTQIHTHMCYSQFNDALAAITAMDADVITLENARSDAELLQSFADEHYPAAVGPGVYDIHSPNVPTEQDMVDRLRAAARVIPRDRLWVNPDCGLKTRQWPETINALKHMVAAAKRLRQDGAIING